MFPLSARTLHWIDLHTNFSREPDLRTHRQNRLKTIHQIADTRVKVCKDARKPLENLEVYSRKVTALTGFELSKIIGVRRLMLFE
jgi:hypothetical protein